MSIEESDRKNSFKANAAKQRAKIQRQNLRSNIVLGIQLFTIFSGVRIFAIFNGVMIIYIPILDDLYFPLVRYIKSLNLEQKLNELSYTLQGMF